MKTVLKKNTSGLLSILSAKIKRYRNKAPETFNIKRSLAEVRLATVKRTENMPSYSMEHTTRCS